MVTTAEEIRARVRRADEQRMSARSAAAEKVAVLASETDELRRVAASKQAELVDAVGAAVAVMTVEELAEFTGRAVVEVRGWHTAAGGTQRRPRGAGSARRGRGGARTPAAVNGVGPASSAAAPAVAEGTAVGAERDNGAAEVGVAH